MCIPISQEIMPPPPPPPPHSLRKCSLTLSISGLKIGYTLRAGLQPLLKPCELRSYKCTLRLDPNEYKGKAVFWGAVFTAQEQKLLTNTCI